MKTPLSLFTLSICFALIISCGKTDFVKPSADNALLKNDCKVETSEVVYKDQDLVDNDGFVKVEQYYSATESFIKTIKGKKLKIVIENVTVAKFALF